MELSRIALIVGGVSFAWACSAVDPAQFGFDPSAEPATNAVALQRALDAGGKVRTSVPGRYRLDRTILLDDGADLEFAKGTVFVKSGTYCNMFRNRGAESGVTNANIVIRNLEIDDGGVNVKPDVNSRLQGLWGQVAFFHVKNLRLTGFRCVDYAAHQYCLQVVGFDGFEIEDFEIRGGKDGIHLNAGRNFRIRNGRLRTQDDGIALNAGEWPGYTPEMGSVTDGLVEDVVDEAGGDCNFVRVITGAWIDWFPGMKLQRGDLFRHAGRLYAVYPAPVSAAETASFHPPTHRQGVWKSPDGLNFLYLQPGDVMRADVTNVVIRNCTVLEPKRRINCLWEIGSWARVLHPKVPGEKYPKIDLRLENVVKDVPGELVRCSADANLVFGKCRAADGRLAVLSRNAWQRTRCPIRTVSVDDGPVVWYDTDATSVVRLADARPNPTRSRISRTLERMAKSTKEKPETVRVLFYGQSIVQQNWGPLYLIPGLQRRYPTVKFVVENRAIGGYQSPSLIKTAESDLYPFYPDLLFFHVYGPTDLYAKIVERVRARTTADIVLWTSHLDAKEGDSPEKIAALLAQLDKRSLDIRATADRFGCMCVDLRTKWCRMLQERNISSRKLLADGIHMKRETLPLYAGMLLEDLLFDGALAPNPQAGDVTVRPGALKLAFSGNRVVAVANGETGAEYDVFLDGKPVGDFPEMWTMTRSSLFPSKRAWNPMIDRIDRGPAAPLDETWTLTFLEGGTTNGAAIPFRLAGSRTGEDGAGWSNQPFTSRSGRVTLRPDGWCSTFWWGYHKTVPTAGTEITWRSKPLVVSPYAPGAKGETSVLVQNCPKGPHVLELRPKKPGPLGVASFVVHAPVCPGTVDYAQN